MQTKLRIELVRLAWITALRAKPRRQCRGIWYTGPANKKRKVCALQLLLEIAGEEDPRSFDAVGALAGLSQRQSMHVYQLWRLGLRKDDDRKLGRRYGRAGREYRGLVQSMVGA
jgi:hypothetical protein